MSGKKPAKTDRQLSQNRESDEQDSGDLQRPDSHKIRHPESAHVCPRCGLSILIKDIGLREATTGIINCTNCDWSGRIEISMILRDSDD